MWLLRHSQSLTEGSCQRAVNSDIPGLDSDSCPSLKKHRFSDKIATEYLCFLYNSLGSPPQAENNRQGVNVMQTKCHKSNKLGQVSDPSVPVCWDMGSDTCPKYEHIVHPFPPLYDESSTILILGSLPSVKSREQLFFYGHPQNRFWKVMAALTDENVPMTIDEKKELLHKHHIALWDTIYSCDIVGSSDSSIKNVVPTDIEPIINNSKITKIFCNGNTSGKYYKKYQQNNIGIEAVVLPSTSPANAAFSLEKLLEVWQKLIVEACGRSLT